MTKLIAVFNSNHDTLEAEKIIKQSSVPIRPIIKPRKISSSCALALEFDLKFQEKVMAICKCPEFSFIGFFQKKNEEWIEI